MTLIDLQSISYKYDTKQILNNINFTLRANQRVAIVGQNGSGKSTLMKIALGNLEQDIGKRVYANNLTIDMLAQEPKFKQGTTVKMAIEQNLKEIYQAKKEYEKLSREVSISHSQELLQELTKISSFLDFHNAWSIEDKIKRVIKEFNLVEFTNKT
jgi:ATP-binding cassette subfamily F protein uup